MFINKIYYRKSYDINFCGGHKMKRILSLLVMVLLIFSAVPVLAEQAKVHAENQIETGEGMENANEEPLTVRERVEERVKLAQKTAEKEFMRAKQAYQRATKDTKESRESFLQTRKLLKGCQDGESEECVALSEQVNQHAKDLVLNGIDGAIEHLNQLKAKYEASDIEGAEDVVANVESAIAELEQAKADVETAETKKEIKGVATNVKKLWSRIRNKERVQAAKLVHAKVFNIIQRAEKLEAKLEKLVARLEAKGIDVATLEASLAEFKSNIEAARAKYEEGKALIEQDAKQARIIIKEAHNLVKKAHNALMDLVRNFRNVGSDVSEADEEETTEEGNNTEESLEETTEEVIEETPVETEEAEIEEE